MSTSIFQWNILEVIYLYLTTPILFRTMIGFVALTILSVAYNPTLNVILKAPLLKYLGMTYGNIYMTVWRLKLRITEITLHPSKSDLVKMIILIIFPSGNVMLSKNSLDFPESKVTVGKITVKVRMSSLAGRSIAKRDADESNSWNKTREDGSMIKKEIRLGWFAFMNHYIPRPVIAIALHNVTVHIEKVYLAPKPSPLIEEHTKKSPRDNLPMALPLSHNADVKDLPTFDQTYFGEMIRDENVTSADALTFQVERWIDHSVTKIKAREGGGDKSRGTSSPKDSQRKDEGTHSNVKTYDEKVNEWIKFFARILCHIMTLDLVNASVIISGAGSDYVSKVRKKYSPREANLMLAKLPKRKRALTVIGADMISFSFSHDSECNLLGCLVGAYLKVGNPLNSVSDSMVDATDLRYVWHDVVNPFQCILEFKGVLPFLVFSLNYDHNWVTRALELNLSISENNLSISPKHIHTVFLHLDDYTDISSPLVQWLEWMRLIRSKRLALTSEEKAAYCKSYAKIIKGMKEDETENDSQHLLTASQMKEMELTMSEWEILSLRCLGMRKHWLIPKGDGEFSEFLRSTKSSISSTVDEDVKMDSLIDGYLSQFQQVYPTPLDALFRLVREKSSILAPHVTFTLAAGTYMFDFPADLDKTESQGGTQKIVIPSSLVSSGVEFSFEQSNPLFVSKSINYDAQRSFIDLSLQVAGLRWDLAVGENDEILSELPLFTGSSAAEIVYERHGVTRLESVLSLELGYSILPTKDREQYFDLTLQTSNLIVVANPLPLLSSLDTIVELLQFPLQPQTVSDEIISGESDVGGSFLGININLNVSVRNISFLFVVDRKSMGRGLLDFNINKIALMLNTGGTSGHLVISTGPFSLDTARVKSLHSHSEDKAGSIRHWLMPLKPILLIEGVEIDATGQKETSRLDETDTETTVLRMNMNISANSFALNASPTTIVAVRGVITSFEPMLKWIQGDADELARIEMLKLEEEKRKTVEIHRRVLKKIFTEIDVDGSGFLCSDELEQVVVMLWKEARPGFALTDEELKKETNYFVTMIDRSKSNEVTYQDLDEAVQMLSDNIHDNNLVPKSRISSSRSGDFVHSDQFLSSFQLRQLIYYEDMKEYASMHVVNEITGGKVNTDGSFPSPSLWRQGRGIDIFWDLYTKATGCSRTSLNGENIESVQRQLVRSFCNYEFAKFCWKSLVSPAMRSDIDSNMINTRWLLDRDHRTIFSSGVTDLLKEHILREMRESMEDRMASPTANCQYDLSVTVAVNSASARFGSSHNFARPLLETNLTNMSCNASALLSGDGSFVETRVSNVHHSESSGTNMIQFQGVMSAMYLNTKHSHMERFIESYPCFGQATYRAMQGDPSLHTQASKVTSNKPSWSVKVDCPRYFNVNTSPSFFETGAIIVKILGQSDLDSHRQFLYHRDLVFIRNLWDSSPALKNGCLDHAGAVDLLCDAIDTHWKLEFEGLSPAARREWLVNIMEGMPLVEDSDGLISFDAAALWLKKISRRNYFTGIEEIQLHNDSGLELKVTQKSNFDRLRASVVNEANFHVIVNSFQSIGHGITNTVPLGEYNETHDFLKQSLCGNLSLYVRGFRLIENVVVNPYQTLMFKLKMMNGIYGRSNRRKRTQGVSGFKPYLTVVPQSTSLDTITLYVRSNIVIRSAIPVRVRIVRLGKSAGQFSKQGLQKRNKKSIDLTKKYLMTALNRAVEGAPIVYEHRCNGGGDVVALPLSVVISSSFHAILIQDVSGRAKNAWRPPLLFTRDFLFNPMNIRDVSRYHTMSGVVIQKERMNVQRTGRGKHNASCGDIKKSMTRRTAWDITILVVPSFLFMNSLPFPVSVRAWQHAKVDSDDDWDEAAATLLNDPTDAVDSSSSDDESAMTPSINNKVDEDQYHFSTSNTSDYYHEDMVNVGETLRLSGINLSQSLFIEVTQHLQTAGAASILRTTPVEIDLQKLQTGMNRKGSRSLPNLVLDLGDNCDCLVDVSLDRASKMPLCTIYSPFWLINKTGMKLEYSVVGANDGAKRYLDSGTGGLPVLMHCSESDETNATFRGSGQTLAVIPLECPREDIARIWWDESTNGKLVLKKNAIVSGKSHLVDWCTRVNLEAAGTTGEVNCDCYILQAQIESLAGAFHRSNLIKLSPRFIVKNTLHISISILPLAGSPQDARKMATYLRESLNESEEKSLITLSEGESSIIYNFNKCHGAVESSYRWVAFRVNARRFGATFKCKWHMIPLDVMQSNLFGEHDGVNNTLSGIIEAKVHSTREGSTLTSISHADTPPFRIENRSQTHYLQISQDDNEAEMFELPPMHSCGYTWDSPLGKKRLRVAVVPGRKSASEINLGEKTLDSDLQSVASTIDSDDDSVEGEASEEPLLRSINKGISTRRQNKSHSSRQWVHSPLSRKYDLQKIGKQKDLHCPKIEADSLGIAKQNKGGECLKVHSRVSTGTKIISFSDSDWLADQVEAGLLREGGKFKNSLVDINMMGAGIYFNDSFPSELIGMLVRDIQICKPMGTIEITTRVRHFQIDAMHPNARYPIIIQPLPLGVDRRMQEIPDSSSDVTITPRSMEIRDCYWKLYDEKPIPLFEMKCSYVPQNNMVWMPSLDVHLAPMKLHMDVNYILRVLSLIFDSVSKYGKEDITSNQAIIHVNEDLSYVTRGSMNICLTYIENFYIHPVEIQLEINIKSDEEDFNNGEDSSSLTLHTISQSTNSEFLAGMMGWLINVGANFAHVSPTYAYTDVRYTDTYSDIIDLAGDVFKFYLVQTIKQCYKVVFSMHLLGDPSLLLHQYKTGVKDLFVKTAEEIAAGGKDGVGKGVSSLVQNVVGGTFFMMGRLTGSLADTITAVATSDLSSENLKPKNAGSSGRNPDHAVDGFVQGTGYVARTTAHGIAGLIGNPYRGIKTGTVSGAAKGVATGIIGVAAFPVAGALGFVAKTTTGIGQTSKVLDLGCIEARCRPRRVVPWGMPMSSNALPYLKGIGIRVHSVRYQKVRKRAAAVGSDGEDDDDNDVSKRERRRIRAAERRRLDPPSKQVSIKYQKDKRHRLTYPIRPKLLSDHPGNLVLSHYAVTFEETIELRSQDLQLEDIVTVNFWNHKTLKTTPKAKALAVCSISVGDMYSHALTYYLEQLKQVESNLAKGAVSAHHPHADQSSDTTLLLPAPQEFPLFRPLKKSRGDRKDIFEAISEEIAAIKKAEEDRVAMFASDSDAESDSSFISTGKKTGDEDVDDLVSRNERLFGSVSLSFFPIPW